MHAVKIKVTSHAYSVHVQGMLAKCPTANPRRALRRRTFEALLAAALYAEESEAAWLFLSNYTDVIWNLTAVPSIFRDTATATYYLTTTEVSSVYTVRKRSQH